MMKQQNKPINIDEYIANFPPALQELLQQIRQVIIECAPEAKETISYQIPTFVLYGNLVHFAGYKYHIGFYPSSSPMTIFADQLKGYKQGRGSVQFPLDKEIPFDLIRDIVLFRVKENTERAMAKVKGKTKNKKE